MTRRGDAGVVGPRPTRERSRVDVPSACGGPLPLRRMVPLSVLGVVVVPLLAIAGAVAAEDIYRCEDGETIVFSDRPCDDAAELHRPRRLLSVVTSPESLARIQQANAAYLESRATELARRRAARAERARSEAQAARYAPSVVRTVPVAPAFPAYPHARSNSGSNAGSNRLEARRDAPERRLRRATDESRPPLAAGGRQLGARREDDDG